MDEENKEKSNREAIRNEGIEIIFKDPTYLLLFKSVICCQRARRIVREEMKYLTSEKFQEHLKLYSLKAW